MLVDRDFNHMVTRMFSRQHVTCQASQAVDCFQRGLQDYNRTGGMSALGVDPDSNKAFIHCDVKG